MSRETYLKAGALRRKAVMTAALCAMVGGGAIAFMQPGHRWIGFACIGVQIILLVIAVNFYRQSMALTSAGRK